MTFSQILGLTKRMGIQIIRSRWTVPYLLLFPIFFIGLYWFGFSASPVGLTQTYSLGVINEDEGLTDIYAELFSNETIMGDTFSMFHSHAMLEQGFGSEFLALLENISV